MKIAIDFDGTCVDHRYPDIGPDVPGAVETMKRLKIDGHQLYLFTMRSGKELEDAVMWLVDKGIILSGVQNDPGQINWTDSPKCYAELYIDDLAYGCPLIRPEGFEKECVDWSGVLEVVEDRK